MGAFFFCYEHLAPGLCSGQLQSEIQVISIQFPLNSLYYPINPSITAPYLRRSLKLYYQPNYFRPLNIQIIQFSYFMSAFVRFSRSFLQFPYIPSRKWYGLHGSYPHKSPSVSHYCTALCKVNPQIIRPICPEKFRLFLKLYDFAFLPAPKEGGAI